MTPGDARDLPATIGELLDAMRHRLDSLPPEQRAARDFLATYLRTTEAVAAAIDAGTFEDPAWVERWDLVFAGLYLDALDAHLSGRRAVRRGRGGSPSRPRPSLPPLLNVLLGVNAHINYDLPQALLGGDHRRRVRRPVAAGPTAS